MSGGAHTAGPWFVSRDHLCDTLVRAKDATNGQRIASTFVSHATQANAETRLARIRENEANARLISAAPDLLVSAISLIEAWDARTSGAQQIITGKSDRDLQKQAMEAMDGLRAAIAKARPTPLEDA